MTERKGRTIAIGVAAVILIGGVAGGIWYKYKLDHQPPKYETTAVERQNLKKTVSITGKIEANKTYKVTTDVADSTVKEVVVSVGDRVKAGDVLARLDTTNLDIQLAYANKNLALLQEKTALDVAAARRDYEMALQAQAEQVAFRQGEEARAEEALEEAEDKQDTAEDKQGMLAGKKDDSVEKYHEAKQARAEAQERAREAADEVTEAQRDLDEANSDRDDLKSQMSSAQVKASASDATDADRRAYESLRSAYDEAVDDAEDARDDLQEAQDAKTEADNELQDAQKAEDEAKSKYNNLHGRTKEANANVRTTDQNVKTADKNAAEAANSLSDTAREDAKKVADAASSIITNQVAGNTSEVSVQLDIAKYNRQLEKCEIKSPCDGVVVTVDVDPGENYKGTTIATVVDDSSYKVKATADQYDISNLYVGQKTRIEVKGAGGKPRKGQLIFVSPTLKSYSEKEKREDTSNNNNNNNNSTVNDDGYIVKSSIDGPADRLRIGMTAKLTVIEEKVKNALAVPGNVIQYDKNNAAYVEVLKEDETTERVMVKKGLVTDYYTQISGKGLRRGTRVVVPKTDETELDDMD